TSRSGEAASAAPIAPIATGTRPSSRTHVVHRQSQIPWLSARSRSEEHTSELQSRRELVCRLLLEKKTGQPGATGGGVMGILSRLSPQATRTAAESAKAQREAAAEREPEAKAAGDVARADSEAAER